MFPTDQQIVEAWHEIKSARHRICKGCGENFTPKQKEKLGGKGYCSAACQKAFPRKKRCKPRCEKTFTRLVNFKDGTTHRQSVCEICRSTWYVTRDIVGVNTEDKVIRAWPTLWADSDTFETYVRLILDEEIKKPFGERWKSQDFLAVKNLPGLRNRIIEIYMKWQEEKK